MIVCDFDGIETSNLTRSVLFRHGDVGRRKVDVACERAMELNPDVICVPIHGDLRFVLGYGLVRRANVVLGCLDSLEARFYLNHHAMKTRTCYIDAALDTLNGNVMSFLAHEGPCYECQMKAGEKKELKRRQSCLKLSREDIALGKIPTAPTISSIIAGMQSQIAVRHIHKLPIPAGRKIGLYGMTDLNFDIKISQDPDCLTHEYTDSLGPDRELIEWSDAKASTLTPRDVLRRMEETLGGPVVWSLDDDRELIIGLHDAESGRHRQILSLSGVLKEDQAIDEESGRVMIPEMLSQFDGSEPAWLHEKSLLELGIPPLHILYGRNIETGRDAYFELSGDLSLYFGDPQES
jgi:molybdopterin/thiamine biosynthesis adenylyltransferase